MAQTKACESGERTLSGGSFFGAVRRRQEQYDAIFTDLQHCSPRKLPRHSHELAFFALLIDGSYGERFRQRDTQFGPFTLMFRPAGIPHQDEIGPHGVKFFEIELRPSWRKRIEDCAGSLDHALEDRGGGPLLWLAVKLFREMHGTLKPDLYAESLLAEMLAEVARLPRAPARSCPSWLGRVTEKLQSEFCRRLTLDELALEAGVHPVHLSRVFRTCVGEGLGEYVHRLRIRQACEQMLAPERTLADISAAAGFADQSHFTRVFRKITGITPRAFRKIVRHEVTENER